MSDMISIDYTHHESLTTDLISRQDAIEALMSHFVPQTYTGEQVEQARKLAKKIVNGIPSASAEQVTGKLKNPCNSLLTDDSDECKEKKSKLEQTDCTWFVNWLLEEVMDEENWELNAVALGEVICRKLKKLGLLEVKDGYYVRTPSAEAVQGEWKQVETHTYKGECTNCGFRHIFMDGHDSQYRYCPNCGARMYKGGDDE